MIVQLRKTINLSYHTIMLAKVYFLCTHLVTLAGIATLMFSSRTLNIENEICFPVVSEKFEGY